MLLTRCIIAGLIQARPDGGLWSPRGQASGDARLPRGPEVTSRRPQPDLASSAAQPQPGHWPRGPGLLPHLRPLPTQPTRLSAGNHHSRDTACSSFCNPVFGSVRSSRSQKVRLSLRLFSGLK